MIWARAIVLCFVISGSGAVAQTQITPDAFLDRAVGKTLTFTGYRSGRVVGVEQFLRRDQSVWAAVDRRCTYGRIDIRGPQICFTYEDFPDPDNCWIPFMDEHGLIVVSNSFDVQRITEISEEPVICENVPLS